MVDDGGEQLIKAIGTAVLGGEGGSSEIKSFDPVDVTEGITTPDGERPISKEDLFGIFFRLETRNMEYVPLQVWEGGERPGPRVFMCFDHPEGDVRISQVRTAFEENLKAGGAGQKVLDLEVGGLSSEKPSDRGIAYLALNEVSLSKSVPKRTYYILIKPVDNSKSPELSGDEWEIFKKVFREIEGVSLEKASENDKKE